MYNVKQNVIFDVQIELPKSDQFLDTSENYKRTIAVGLKLYNVVALYDILVEVLG